jgi:hypothetical protein
MRQISIVERMDRAERIGRLIRKLADLSEIHIEASRFSNYMGGRKTLCGLRVSPFLRTAPIVACDEGATCKACLEAF